MTDEPHFEWPVGLPDERKQYAKLPGAWIDATGYGVRYSATGKWAIHTGLDLNLNTPTYDADAHSPVYAACDGQVVFAGKLPVWGSVITIKHGGGLWTRYAHGEALQVQTHQWVKRGDQLCKVGNADGRYPYHLHYDIAEIDLGAKPGDWPGDNLARVQRDYINPVEFMRAQLLEDRGDCPYVVQVTAYPRLNVRAEPNTNAAIVGKLNKSDLAYVIGQTIGGLWYNIDHPMTGWIMAQYTQVVQ